MKVDAWLNFYCSVTTISFASALNPIFAWLPSQYGLVFDDPHLQNAVKTFPSTRTNSGPFPLHLISTLAMTSRRRFQYISDPEPIK